tara:strand:+ start:612 stop:914 length:303 start_codon:yes stop_codon:yes gene_type:complete
MKNENYLERIALALETLVNQGNSLSADFIEDPAPVKKPITIEHTHDDLKSACLELSRNVKDGRTQAKAILSGFGAVKATDVKVSEISTVIGLLNAALVRK